MTALLDYAPVLSRFRGLRPDPPSRSYASAECPVKAHRNARLRFWVKADKLMFGCYGGCDKALILHAVGLTWKCCFPPKEGDRRMEGVKPKVVAVYPYRDENRVLLYESVRFEPGLDGRRKKDLRYRRVLPDGRREWGVDGVRRVLYRLPELLADSKKGSCCVVEGEKKADLLALLGLTVTTNPFGADGWRMEYGAFLSGRRVAVFPDANEAGERHALAVAASCIYCDAQSVRVVHLPGLPEGGGVDDFLAALPSEQRFAALVAQIRRAKAWKPE